MTSCLFCRMMAGAVEAHVVLDTRDGGGGVFAFLDHRPLFEGHTLVIPEQHHETLADLPGALVAGYFTEVQRVARVVERVMEAAGTFVAMNNRISQSVPHLHTHVVPRNPKDGLRGFFWPRTKYADDEAMAAVAAHLRDGLVADLAGEAPEI